MKHKKIFFSSLIMIIAAAAVITIAQTSYAVAANDNAVNKVNRNGQMKNKHGELANWSKMMGNKSNMVSQADREKRHVAVDSALQAGDYNAWVQAVGTSSPILTKINATNFPKFVQAYQLRKQADAIMAELGLNQGMKYGIQGVAQSTK